MFHRAAPSKLPHSSHLSISQALIAAALQSGLSSDLTSLSYKWQYPIIFPPVHSTNPDNNRAAVAILKALYPNLPIRSGHRLGRL
jgi:hypothetical protein